MAEGVVIAPPGRWTRWKNPSRNESEWHWVHKTDPTTYCGFRPRGQILDTLSQWNPLRVCRKCFSRIQREGY